MRGYCIELLLGASIEVSVSDRHPKERERTVTTGYSIMLTTTATCLASQMAFQRPKYT